MENWYKLLEKIKELGFETILVLIGGFTLFVAFCEITDGQFGTRPAVDPTAMAIGIGAIGLGVALYFAPGGKRRKNSCKRIIFYAPTLKANSFFAELLDYAGEQARTKKINLEIEKGEAGIGMHEGANYLDVLKKYDDPSAQPVVIVMIPPSPDCYPKIWEWKPRSKLKLITLDMEVSPSDERFRRCEFHRSVIIADNAQGSDLGAREVRQCCQAEGLSEINVIVCEGGLHQRGKIFKQALNQAHPDHAVRLHWLGDFLQLSFSDAVRESFRYVRDILERNREALNQRPTFIFCANDNLAIGTRMALSNTLPLPNSRIRIICFDASIFVKTHIDLGDNHFWRAIDQKYWEIVQEAFGRAERLLAGETIEKEVRLIRPVIYGR